MTLRKVIKANAKQSLKGSFGRAIAILLIMLLVVCALGALDSAVYNLLGLPNAGMDALAEGIITDPAAVDYAHWAMQSLPTMIYTAVVTVVELLLIVPLALGVINWYLDLSDGKRQSVGRIFWPFECRAYWRSIWLQICVFFRTWLFSLLMFAIPTALFAFAIAYLQGVSLNAAAIVTTVAAVLMLFLVLLVVVFTMRYSIAQLLLCEKYSMTVGKALKNSVRYTKGHRWELLGLTLSFIPWFLLCVLIVPIFYVLPYYQMTHVMYTRYLYEDGMHHDGLLDTSDRDSIIIDDISPEKIPQPVAPSIPSVPEQPAAPEIPLSPEIPAQPVAPTAPAEPVVPPEPKNDGYAEL